MVLTQDHLLRRIEALEADRAAERASANRAEVKLCGVLDVLDVEYVDDDEVKVSLIREIIERESDVEAVTE